MANNIKPTETLDDLRAEFDDLRSQVNELVKELKTKSEEKAEKLGKKLENYQEKAEEKLHDAHDFGEASIKDLGKQINKNPVTSLLVAFSVGYIISKILGLGK